MKSCVEEQNHDSQVYNEKLGKLLPQLQKSLPGSKVLYADVYKPLADLINSPKNYGNSSILIWSEYNATKKKAH